MARATNQSRPFNLAEPNGSSGKEAERGQVDQGARNRRPRTQLIGNWQIPMYKMNFAGTEAQLEELREQRENCQPRTIHDPSALPWWRVRRG